MNIKLSSNELRVRLKGADVALLRNDQMPSLLFAPCSGHAFNFKCQLTDTNANVLSLTVDKSEVTLFISREAFRDLEQRLPSRHGLQQVVKDARNLPLTLILEVDLRP